MPMVPSLIDAASFFMVVGLTLRSSTAKSISVMG